ncbi:MAG: hypothetical protein COT91_02080 [Candidatus Doudnabacteria bacterium CG10_big_fil_rev_8_21_14_0_10_41_10]|uniref:Magnesium transporter n=1 Tax=Candidatus Doudnabacteria bacterium CG10_big_fil_rev_8_21_14_0_10_41_10 TaxID=1974551 RepID=A0A2H0VG12_9BACT|nr:MAG: hypothetical protein COT91_02080 [Candidatus Doudnabacteria bacterium CG10_big_fil_rev_8_21_14_0_10_41_10]
MRGAERRSNPFYLGIASPPLADHNEIDLIIVYLRILCYNAGIQKLSIMIEIKIYNQNKLTQGSKSDLANKKTSLVQVTSPRVSDWVEVSKITGLDARDLKEFLYLSERPVVRNLGVYTAVSFRSPSLNGKSVITKPNLFLISEQRRHFFSISQGNLPANESVGKLPSPQLERVFKEGPTTLLYVFLDEVINNYRQVLDHFNEEVENVEGAVLRGQYTQDITKNIFKIRKTLVYFVRALFANQEVVSAIEKGQGKNLSTEHESRFGTLYADIEQLEDLSGIYREILSSSLEVHLSNISNNLNVIMKRLTSWAAIILVPTLIAGIYGMNVNWLPFTTTNLGGVIVLTIMLLSVLALYTYFSKRGWL